VSCASPIVLAIAVLPISGGPVSTAKAVALEHLERAVVGARRDEHAGHGMRGRQVERRCVRVGDQFGERAHPQHRRDAEAQPWIGVEQRTETATTAAGPFALPQPYGSSSPSPITATRPSSALPDQSVRSIPNP
jgi:hypothetical protein